MEPKTTEEGQNVNKVISSGRKKRKYSPIDKSISPTFKRKKNPITKKLISGNKGKQHNLLSEKEGEEEKKNEVEDSKEEEKFNKIEKELIKESPSKSPKPKETETKNKQPIGRVQLNGVKIRHHSHNDKVTKSLVYWSDPLYNSSWTYDIVKIKHPFLSQLGESYIGPQNFIVLKKKVKKPTNSLEFNIGGNKYSFNNDTLIIPGISLKEVIVSADVEIFEISAPNFVYHESQRFFLPYDAVGTLGFVKNNYSEENPVFYMKNIHKLKKGLLLNTFKKSMESSNTLDIYDIPPERLEELFIILENEPLTVICLLNNVMRGIDSQMIANMVLSHQYEFETTNDYEILRIFEGNNNPPYTFSAWFKTIYQLCDLIRKIKKTNYSVKCLKGSIFCSFSIDFLDVCIRIRIVADLDEPQKLEISSNSVVHDDFESKIKMTECLKGLECLTNAQLDDPRVILNFHPINFPPGAPRNMIANLLLGYSTQAPNTNFVLTNNLPVGEFYTATNTAPNIFDDNFVHSDLILACLKRIHNEAANANWLGMLIGTLRVSAPARKMNLINFPLGFL